MEPEVCPGSGRILTVGEFLLNAEAPAPAWPRRGNYAGRRCDAKGFWGWHCVNCPAKNELKDT
jgi:hypothetical protein